MAAHPHPSRPIALRRIVLVVALALLAAACGRGLDDSLAGVTTSTAPPTTTTTTLPEVVIDTTTTLPEAAEPITVWTPPRYASAVEAAAADFTTASGVAVEVLPLELAEIRTRAAGGFAATDPPDVFVGEHTWLGELRAAGLVEPVGLDARAGEFVPVAADAFRAGGSLYGAPFSLSALVLFRNVELAPEAPTGVSQIKDRCEALVAGAGDGDTTTTTSGDTTTTTEAATTTTTTAAGTTTTTAAGGEGEFELEQCLVVPTDDPLPGLIFLTAPGGYLVGRDDAGDWSAGDVGLAGEAAIQGAGFLAEVVQEDFVSGATAGEALALFTGGVSPYLLATADTDPELTGNAFAASALPLMGGNTPVPAVTVRGFYLRAGGDRLEAAGVLVRDHLAAPPAMAAMAAADDLAPAYAAAVEELPDDALDRVVLASAERGAPLPAVEGIDAALEAVAAAITSIVEPAGGDDAPTTAEIMETAAADVAAAIGG